MGWRYAGNAESSATIGRAPKKGRRERYLGPLSTELSVVPWQVSAWEDHHHHHHHHHYHHIVISLYLPPSFLPSLPFPVLVCLSQCSVTSQQLFFAITRPAFMSVSLHFPPSLPPLLFSLRPSVRHVLHISYCIHPPSAERERERERASERAGGHTTKSVMFAPLTV